MASRDPVLKYVHEAQAAGTKYGIPADVLLGLIRVESGGNPNSTSSAGAQGLTQFIPGTARSYGVQFGSSASAIRSQVEGAARYLHDLGYSQDPRAALAKYNAGPAAGFLSRAGAYPSLVLGAAQRYKGARQAGADPTTGGGTTGASSGGGGGGGGGFFDNLGRTLLKLFLTLAAAAAGLALAGIGLGRVTGVKGAKP
jgi:hypothetical protein